MPHAQIQLFRVRGRQVIVIVVAQGPDVVPVFLYSDDALRTGAQLDQRFSRTHGRQRKGIRESETDRRERDGRQNNHQRPVSGNPHGKVLRDKNRGHQRKRRYHRGRIPQAQEGEQHKLRQQDPGYRPQGIEAEQQTQRPLVIARLLRDHLHAFREHEARDKKKRAGAQRADHHQIAQVLAKAAARRGDEAQAVGDPEEQLGKERRQRRRDQQGQHDEGGPAFAYRGRQDRGNPQKDDHQHEHRAERPGTVLADLSVGVEKHDLERENRQPGRERCDIGPVRAAPGVRTRCDGNRPA